MAYTKLLTCEENATSVAGQSKNRSWRGVPELLDEILRQKAVPRILGSGDGVVGEVIIGISLRVIHQHFRVVLPQRLFAFTAAARHSLSWEWSAQGLNAASSHGRSPLRLRLRKKGRSLRSAPRKSSEAVTAAPQTASFQQPPHLWVYLASPNGSWRTSDLLYRQSVGLLQRVVLVDPTQGLHSMSLTTYSST